MVYSCTLKNLYLFLLVFSITNKAFAIVGGEPLSAQDAVLKTIVNIKLKNGMCTGSLIAPKVVLTAAHCMDINGPAEVVAHINGTPTQSCDISKVVDFAFVPGAVQDLPMNVHSPDILLLKLETSLCSAKTIETASGVPIETSDSLLGAGHGRGNKKFGKAEFFKLQVIESTNLLSLVSPMSNINKELLTAGAQTYKFALPLKSGSSFCTGDSGGPVYKEANGIAVQYAVNGAVLPNQELGAAGCDNAYLQLITPLAPYKLWIEQIIMDWE